MKASRLLLISIVITPAILLADKTQDQLVSIQRDVADLSYQVKQIQKTLDDKVAAQSALLQQAIDQMNKMAAAIPAMQKEIDQKLADEQTKLVGPVATLGSKVDGMSSDVGSLRENVAELLRKINDMDQKITDMNSTVRTLTTPTQPPPPGPNGATGTTTQVPDNAPPPGMSAEVLYANAQRDHRGGKDDLALDEFSQYVKYFKQSENAPNAEYFIGQIYYQAKQWPDAIKAFDSVLADYPMNPRRPDAQYYKACALLNNDQKTAAGDEFKDFLKRYPSDAHAAEARKHLQELGLRRAK